MDGTSSEPCCDLPWKAGRYPACRQSNWVRAGGGETLAKATTENECDDVAQRCLKREDRWPQRKCFPRVRLRSCSDATLRARSATITTRLNSGSASVFWPDKS